MKEHREENSFLFAHFFFLAKKKYGAERNSFLIACFFFLVKKKYGAGVFSKPPKEHRGANPFLFAYFFFLVKKKYGAKRKTFLIVCFFFLVKKKYGVGVFGKLPKEHHGAEPFSFCLLFLFSKEKVDYWAAARAKAFLRTMK